MNKGLVYALGAYLTWGLLPIYWKLLHVVTPLEIVSHRIVWSFVVVLAILAYRRQWQWLKPTLHDRKTLLTFVLISILITVNWGVYIWAVNAGFVVETSLGYFINPLINVVLGVFFLRERLRLWQWVAVGVAFIGVLYLTLTYGTLPWVALTLAFSFGFYGLLKKTASLNALEGFSLETAFIFGPALLYLAYLQLIGAGSWGQLDLTTELLLIFSGVITAGPLLMFAAAARRIPLSLLGLLQYLAPTMQFLLGVFVYGEPFSRSRLVGFSLIWLALIIYSTERVIEYRRHRIVGLEALSGGP
jgi:chloramphenicol-sensitive protein RarD